MIDWEQLAQESALFPWLDSDCMSDIAMCDSCNDSFFTDDDYFYDNEEDL